MTYQEIVRQACDAAGVKRPVRCLLKPVTSERDVGTFETRALYYGCPHYGWHTIAVSPQGCGGTKTIAFIYAICHEIVHAWQCEQIGNYPEYERDYRLAEKLFGYWKNPYEAEARWKGAKIAEGIATVIGED